MSTIPALMLGQTRPSKTVSREYDKYFDLLEQIIQQLQEQTGSTSFEVSGQEDFYGVVPPFISNLIDKTILENYEFAAGDTAYTTTGYQFITCLNSADGVITLNTSPEDGEDVLVWRAGDGNITVSGSINGSSSVIIRQKYDSPHFKFSASANQWAIV